MKMILEEETYRRFGYYSGDLSYGSGKRIIIACDDCGKKREIVKNNYRTLCPSCAHKGKNHSEATKQKIYDANKGENCYNWKGGKIKRICKQCGIEFPVKPSEIKKGAGKYCSHKCARKAQVFQNHHTKPERIFEQICKKHNLPFKYTGDGSFWIGKNPSINPDFVECDGKKIVIEVFGDYWHSPLLNRGLKENRTLPYRKRILKKYGWKLIVFWDTDLLRKDAEAFILNILREKKAI